MIHAHQALARANASIVCRVCACVAQGSISWTAVVHLQVPWPVMLIGVGLACCSLSSAYFLTFLTSNPANGTLAHSLIRGARMLAMVGYISIVYGTWSFRTLRRMIASSPFYKNEIAPLILKQLSKKTWGGISHGVNTRASERATRAGRSSRLSFIQGMRNSRISQYAVSSPPAKVAPLDARDAGVVEAGGEEKHAAAGRGEEKDVAAGRGEQEGMGTAPGEEKPTEVPTALL